MSSNWAYYFERVRLPDKGQAVWFRLTDLQETLNLHGITAYCRNHSHISREELEKRPYDMPRTNCATRDSVECSCPYVCSNAASGNLWNSRLPPNTWYIALHWLPDGSSNKSCFIGFMQTKTSRKTSKPQHNLHVYRSKSRFRGSCLGQKLSGAVSWLWEVLHVANRNVANPSQVSSRLYLWTDKWNERY